MTPAAPLTGEPTEHQPRPSATEGPGGTSRVSDELHARALHAEIIRPDRVYPIVGLSCTYRRRDPPIPADRAREVVWPTVPIYIIESREARLLDGLLDGVSAYNGAARVWFPGVGPTATAGQHPLIYDRSGGYGEDAIRWLAKVFAHRPPDSEDELSPRERAVIELRSVPSADLRAPVIRLSTPKDLRRLTSDLRADREHPIVVLTHDRSGGPPRFPTTALSEGIDSRTPIYVLTTAALARRLTQTVGEPLAVNGGDARIYWPGAAPDEDPSWHPLVPARDPDDPRPPAERLMGALQLSRPGVRTHVQALQQRLARAEQHAAEKTRAARAARGQAAVALQSAEHAQALLAAARQQLAAMTDAGVDQAEIELIAGLDLDGRLRRLITREWLRSTPTAAERDQHPLRYIFAPGFIERVKDLAGTSIGRIAWVAAMVASDRAKSLAGIDPHPLRTGRAGSTDQLTRPDAKAWICKLNGEGASRLHYWVRDDGFVN